MGGENYWPNSGEKLLASHKTYYAHFTPEYGVNVAREVLEKRWRETGEKGPGEKPPEKPLTTSDSKVVDFQSFRRERHGGGGRIRTAE